MSFDLLTIFGAGILTFLTPCVLPLIPVYLAALVGGDISNMTSKQKGQLLIRSGFFSMGFILVFTLMGLGASTIGAFLSDHKVTMQIIGAAIILGFALKFLGLIKIPMLDQIIKADDTKLQFRFGSINAFIMGIVFAAGWSPCVGPVLGSILTYTASTTTSPLAGGLYLSVYGLGFALPLLVTAAFAEFGMKLIGKMSSHLPKIEKSIGVILIFVAGMLVVDIVPEIAHGKPSGNAGITASGDKKTTAITQFDLESNGLPIMVELYKANCQVCKKMEPVVESIQTQCDQKGVHIRTIDVSKPENSHLIREFRLIGVPTFIFLDEFGVETARLVGEQTGQALKQTISVIRGELCPGVARIDNNLGWQSDQPSNNCNI